MDARLTALGKEKDGILRRLAEIQVEQQRLAGGFASVPHYSTLEGAARALGQEVSRAVQERLGREVAAAGEATACCPTCREECVVRTTTRTVKSLDGPIELLEPVAHCSACRRDFFPST